MYLLWLTVLIILREVLCQEFSIHYASSNDSEQLNPVSFVDNSHQLMQTIDERSNMTKREADPTFRGHPKTREEKWALAFHGKKTAFDQIPSLLNLLFMLARNHLNECTPIILYDSIVENSEALFLQQLMRNFPLPYVHGKLTKENTITNDSILGTISKQCVSYILFLADVMKSADILGLQATSKVILVARSSQWRVQEFLYDKASRFFVNLLVIAQSFRDDETVETPFILYTHELFIDGLGASRPVVLTSWMKGKLARPYISLFPEKMANGYAGHRFTVVAANQPPFVFKTVFLDFLGNPQVSWEGVEYRLVNLLGHMNNFSVEIKEPDDLSIGSGDAVWKEISDDKADIGIGGLFVTNDRKSNIDMSVSHSQDCAAFISLTSTALPRYRAIMGPFHWTVWVALTFTYLFGIFPLAFSDKHTLRHLIHNTGEIENMFWYVFGTFTNCFTFYGKNSWSRTTKVTTRLLIGWYWIFTIIITACYTGSIIAFVTLPVYPATVDTVQQLLGGHFRIGTLDRGGWERWFLNSSDERTNKLFKHLELVPDIEAGLMNTTKAFFWSYAFLGSKFQLEYVVQSNFTLESSKRSVLHISDECFVPFGVSLAFPKESVYTERLNRDILRMIQSGIVTKLMNEVKWKMQRSSTGKLLQVSSGSSLRDATAMDRGLSLDDTQGMFLLLAAGFLAAAVALLTEWMGGCGRMCRRRRHKSASTVSTTSMSTVTDKSQIAPTPNSKSEEEFDRIHADEVEAKLEEFDENDEKAQSAGSERNVLVQSIEVCADVVQSTKEFAKGHSRRSSSVDWDSEINNLFSYSKSDMESDEEQNKGKSLSIIEIEEQSEEEKRSITDVLGEKVEPV